MVTQVKSWLFFLPRFFSSLHLIVADNENDGIDDGFKCNRKSFFLCEIYLSAENCYIKDISIKSKVFNC